MKLKDYQQETKRTLPDLGNETLNVLHMVLGMNSEFDELYNATDDVNRSEEVTDIFWYLSNYCNIKDIDLWRVFEVMPNLYYYINLKDDYVEQLQVAISKLTDLEKKKFAYGKTIERINELEAVCEVAKRINDCYAYFNFNPEEAMGKNINKLKVRFPDKFTKENAINRNLVEERNVLE